MNTLYNEFIRSYTNNNFKTFGVLRNKMSGKTTDSCCTSWVCNCNTDLQCQGKRISDSWSGCENITLICACLYGRVMKIFRAKRFAML